MKLFLIASVLICSVMQVQVAFGLRLGRLGRWLSGAVLLSTTLGPLQQAAVAAIYPDTVLTNMATPSTEKGKQAYGLKDGRLLKCNRQSNCISTSSVASVEKYGRPWSFSGTGEEEFDRIIAAAKQIDFITIAEQDKDNMYIHLTAKSAVPPTGLDDIEFLINAQDHIITYRSNSREIVFAGTQQVGDGGSNKNRLASLQRKFGVREMGDYSSEYFENQSSGLPFDGLLPSANLFKYQSMANEPSDINFLDNSVGESSPPPLD
jgi:uncharacterized protein (DUF1499 family)